MSILSNLDYENPISLAYSIGIMPWEHNAIFFKKNKPYTNEQIRKLQMRMVVRNVIRKGLLSNEELLTFKPTQSLAE